jgi:hypothetical protein
MSEKELFAKNLTEFAGGLNQYVSTEDGQWSVKGFIDTFKNIFTISSDTKIVSKILEIHLFPKFLDFANTIGYDIVIADHQNYYPDLSFVKKDDESIRFAIDFKTTYRKPKKPLFCNGFTLGSHGEYFINRTSLKNIQFPYSSYSGHFCLGIIYDRVPGATIDATSMYRIDQLEMITSVVKNFQFFVMEKWRIASDTQLSGNTANIGSIKNIENIIKGNGVFAKLGEKWFDDYWINYGKIHIPDGKGGTRVITTLREFVEYKKGDPSLIVSTRNEEDD